MLVDLEKRAAQAVEITQKAGADEAWATASQSRDVEFEYRDGALEKVQDTTSRNLAIKVYADGRYSTHTTTDLNPDRLQSFIDEAVAITRALEPDSSRRITPAELFANRPTGDLDIVDAQVQNIDRDQRLAWCQQRKDVNTMLPPLEYHPDFETLASYTRDTMEGCASGGRFRVVTVIA